MVDASKNVAGISSTTPTAGAASLKNQSKLSDQDKTGINAELMKRGIPKSIIAKGPFAVKQYADEHNISLAGLPAPSD